MDVLYPRCCGIDIHKKSITVCVLIRESGRKETKADPGIRHYHLCDFELWGLAARSGSHSRRHAIDWGLLATNLEPVGRSV